MPGNDHEVTMAESRTTLSITEGKEVASGTAIQEIDRRELVEVIIASGIEPVSVEAEPHKIIFIFVVEEIKDVVNRLLSNKPFLIDYQKLIYARDYWNNAVTLWKSSKSQKVSV